MQSGLPTNLLQKKYNNLINCNKELFVQQASISSSRLAPYLEILDDYEILLIYENGNRNALIYMLSIYYSLNKNEVLDYQVVLSQTLIDEYFADKDRDVELSELSKYTDLLYIIISEADYKHDYLDTIVKNLIEQRSINKKKTIIIYETVNDFSQGRDNILTIKNLVEKKGQLVITHNASENPRAKETPSIKIDKKSRRII